MVPVDWGRGWALRGATEGQLRLSVRDAEISRALNCNLETVQPRPACVHHGGWSATLANQHRTANTHPNGDPVELRRLSLDPSTALHDLGYQFATEDQTGRDRPRPPSRPQRAVASASLASGGGTGFHQSLLYGGRQYPSGHDPSICPSRTLTMVRRAPGDSRTIPSLVEFRRKCGCGRALCRERDGLWLAPFHPASLSCGLVMERRKRCW